MPESRSFQHRGQCRRLQAREDSMSCDACLVVILQCVQLAADVLILSWHWQHSLPSDNSCTGIWTKCPLSKSSCSSWYRGRWPWRASVHHYLHTHSNDKCRLSWMSMSRV